MSLRIALLGLLSAVGPSSGYDLAKKFEHSLNHVWQAGHTQIYPELVKMAADGLVAVESEGARGRKTYTILPEGRRHLHDWMVGHEASVVIRNEIALKAFLLTLLERDEAITVVERIKTGYETRLAALECYAGDRAGVGRYALKLGLAQVRTGLAWADETLAELRDNSV